MSNDPLVNDFEQDLERIGSSLPIDWKPADRVIIRQAIEKHGKDKVREMMNPEAESNTENNEITTHGES